MAILTIRPNANHTTGSLSQFTEFPALSNKWDNVFDNDGDSTYIYQADTNAAQAFFHAAPNIAAGSIISNVRIVIIVRKTPGTATYLYPRLIVNGQNHNGAAINVAETYTEYTEDYAVNPESTVAWTVDDINGVGATPLEANAVQAVLNTGEEVRVTELYLEVTYTPPAAAVISIPTATSITYNSVVPGITTDSVNGTVYCVAVPTLDGIPSEAQIIAGTNSVGALAPSSSIVVAGSPQALPAITGLTESTLYDLHFVQFNGSNSNIESVEFATIAAPAANPNLLLLSHSGGF